MFEAAQMLHSPPIVPMCGPRTDVNLSRILQVGPRHLHSMLHDIAVEHGCHLCTCHSFIEVHNAAF